MYVSTGEVVCEWLSITRMMINKISLSRSESLADANLDISDKAENVPQHTLVICFMEELRVRTKPR